MSTGLQGLEAMRQTLNTTKDKIVKRACKAGINAGLVPLVKAMRSGVNSSGASPALKREARKMLAKRLKKSGSESIGKAGFAVGKQTKAKKERAEKRSGDKTRPGVGVSGSNIHWFVLGTEERFTGTRTWKTKKGQRRTKITKGNRRYTGRIPDLLKGVTTMAAGTAGPAMVEAARRKIEEVLAREVAKVAKKKGVR